jgi:protein-tyrosine phosphatase
VNLQSVFPSAQAPIVTRGDFCFGLLPGPPEKGANPAPIRYGLGRSHVAHYIDLHCHILPGLDDGAPDLATSMEMLRELVDLGFSEICATPHQRNGLFMPTEAAIAQAFEELRKEAGKAQPGVRVRLGAETYWDEILLERLRKHTVPCYDGRRAFLCEVNPVLLPPRLDEALFEIRLAGCLPVMAHPERYLPVQREPGFAEAMARQAALVVDLEALAGTHPRAESKTARRLVEEGLAHAAASDLHEPESSADVGEGIAWIGKRMGSTTVTRLLEENPRRILGGELP